MSVYEKNIDKKYRPVPFWSWNEKLNIEETRTQVTLMDEAGLGGFFMHARGGLSTPYLGEEWFANVEAAVDEAHQRGLHAWAYDENGWPSGFGGGKVNGLGIGYQQKYLRLAEERPSENSIGKCGGHWFYYEVNPFYVDTLDKKVISEFLQVAYEPYYQKFGNRIDGFFTDEPQISRNGIPWSFVFTDEYTARYGDDLTEHLEELFLPVGDYKETRIRFWKMVTDLFSEAYCRQIYDWCKARGLKLTGHLVLEETLETQLITNGACMPHYEYFDIPGMDWLGREITPCLTHLQVASVAQQLGKEAVLSETFALCGHNVSFAEMKGIYEWQMVHGINLLCQHLEGYSLRGIRKRDYPPALYYQQPWWNEYHDFLEPLSRTGMLLADGSVKAEVLLIHPQTTAWSLFDCGENKGLTELNEAFLDQIRMLENKHVVFHLGDETILERHGKVDGSKLKVGTQSYTYVVASCGEWYLPETKKLLEQFEKNGGILCQAEEVPDNPVCTLPEISYTCRETEEGRLHYFVNTSPEEKLARILVNGYMLDPVTGEKKPLCCPYTFEPWGSLLVAEDDKAVMTKPEKRTIISAEGPFNIIDTTENVLTLDRCDYYFDDVLQEKNGYVLNIAERAITLERPVNIRQEFHVRANALPEKMTLVCETPKQYRILINGEEIEQKDEGYFMDRSFRRLDISGDLHSGENTITLLCDFRQSQEFYEKMRRARLFESEKNMLTYDMEIEALYLVGDFGVQTPGTWDALDKDAVRYRGEFILDRKPERIVPEHMEQQCFPFFAGKMILEKEIDIPDAPAEISVERKGVQAVKVALGNQEKNLLTENEMTVDQPAGKAVLRLTLTNNLRNMLGPHHLEEGETYFAGPHSFYKETCVWNLQAHKAWDEGYCFVETTLKLKG